MFILTNIDLNRNFPFTMKLTTLTYKVIGMLILLLFVDSSLEASVLNTDSLSIDDNVLINKKVKRSFNRNRINVDLLALVDNGPSYISYERLNKTGRIGVEIPFNYHVNGQGMMGYSTGINLKLYFSGKGKGFFFGPSFCKGVFKFTDNKYVDVSTRSDLLVSLKAGYQFHYTQVVGFSLSGTYGYFITDRKPAMSINLGINFSFGG